MRQLVSETHASVSGERKPAVTCGEGTIDAGPRGRVSSRVEDKKLVRSPRYWRSIRVRWLTDDRYFIVGNPMAFQALKPPAMERTFL
jgi:hypothetical protein